MSTKNPKDLIVDESGFMNDAMKKKLQEIKAKNKKSKLQGTVIPVNPNIRVIKRGK